MNTPRASIVIAAHNEEKYLERTLKAADAIIYPDFEIIVIDNLSTDHTLEIAERFAQANHIHPLQIIREERPGVQNARQAGYLAATGEIVAFLDADCLPKPDWLSRSAAALEKGYVGISGPYCYYDGGYLLEKVTTLFQRTMLPPIHHIFQFFKIGGVMIFGNCATTKKNLAAIGGINTSIKFYGDDTDLAKKLTGLGPVLFDTHYVTKSSARRFEKHGLIRTTILYAAFLVSGDILQKELLALRPKIVDSEKEKLMNQRLSQ